jgi:hypothetical protein
LGEGALTGGGFAGAEGGEVAIGKRGHWCVEAIQNSS